MRLVVACFLFAALAGCAGGSEETEDPCLQDACLAPARDGQERVTPPPPPPPGRPPLPHYPSDGATEMTVGFVAAA